MGISFSRRTPLASAVGKNTAARAVGKSSTRESSKQFADKGRGFQSQSAFNTGVPNASMSELPIGIDSDPLLDGMDYDLDDRACFNLYRDMYHHDPVAGCVVDLYSTLPFSEFTLSGGESRHLAPYQEVIERLSFRTIFPQITVDYLVTGTFLGSMLFNKREKTFEDLMTHRADNATIKPLPFVSQDPIIEMTVAEEIRETLRSDSPRIEALRKRLGNEFIDKLLNDRMELDPLSTIYIPRKSFSFGSGTSFFKRILPLFLIEKNLYRGTLIESGKRQRGIMHIQMGDGDQWEATPEDLEAALELFQNADADPLGAIVATRLGVMIDELRQGGDFWKITDIWDQTTQFKMRALGVGDAFLSGDANYSTMEGSMTVFIESIRAHRDHITRCALYNKVFPLVAMLKGLQTNRKGKIIQKDGLMQGDVEEMLRTQNDGSRLFIPQVHWNKQLKPEGDQAYMDMLTALEEKGVPVPLRALAAAGGFNLDSLLGQQDEDLSIMKDIGKYKQKVNEVKAAYGGGGGDDGGGGGGFGGFSSMSNVLDNGKLRGFNRDFGEAQEIVGQTKTGKKKYVHNQRLANRKANEAMNKALINLRQKPSTLTHRSVTPYSPKTTGLNNIYEL